eukprot:6075340-Lingulodinium_polyedra.AAC.1
MNGPPRTSCAAGPELRGRLRRPATFAEPSWASTRRRTSGWLGAAVRRTPRTELPCPRDGRRPRPGKA